MPIRELKRMDDYEKNVTEMALGKHCNVKKKDTRPPWSVIILDFERALVTCFYFSISVTRNLYLKLAPVN